MKWSAYNSGTVNTTKKIAKMVAADDAKERKQEPEVPCKTHPDAPHGFDRNASHSADRYVCECEGWEPPKREWVGFTHEELAWLNEALNLGGRLAVIEAIEKALKEKNT
jgi:hypothetical protein